MGVIGSWEKMKYHIEVKWQDNISFIITKVRLYYYFTSKLNGLRFKEPIILDHHFNEIIHELEYSSDHYFITGKAGTGKSTLLTLFRNTTKKRVVVLAPTGVAALHVKGQTIHSFFGFAPKLMDSSEIKKKNNKKIYHLVETIIIDEISMVRADILDHIDKFLRIHRNSTEPFGGVQMLFFGDLFQLPPVVATAFEKNYFQSYYESPYFFHSKVMTNRDLNLRYIELTNVYRQEEKRFINLLDSIRSNELDWDDLSFLNERFDPDFVFQPGYITLTARNAKADQINRRQLAKIAEPEFSYPAKIEGMFDPRLYPTDAILKLKIGAQVMLLKNDPMRRYVNGTIGIVETLTDKNVGISVKDETNKKHFIELEKGVWELLKYKNRSSQDQGIEAEVVGTFYQFPIRLAWAVTIHKSQGKTFEQVIIDMGKGAFEHGQTYVALSRCKTLEGVQLNQPIEMKDILVDPRIIDFYEDCARI